MTQTALRRMLFIRQMLSDAVRPPLLVPNYELYPQKVRKTSLVQAIASSPRFFTSAPAWKRVPRRFSLFLGLAPSPGPEHIPALSVRGVCAFCG